MRTVVAQILGIFINAISHSCDRTRSFDRNNHISGKFIISRYLFVKKNGRIYLDNSDFQHPFDEEIFNQADCFVAMKFVHRCIAIFIATNNTFYCSLHTEHRVVQLVRTHNSCVEIESAGNGMNDSMSHSLNFPHGIFVDINFDLYVADSGNDRIQLFRSSEHNGSTVAGNQALGSIGLHRPTAVVLDRNGYLFIIDQGHHRIIRSHEHGFRCVVGCSNVHPLNHPQALWFDSFGHMFVLDQQNSRIQRFLLSDNSCDIDDRKISSVCLTRLTCWNPIHYGFNCSFSNTYCDLYKPCQNDGTCNNNDTHDRRYTCLCPPGFSGDLCQNDDRLCKPSTCWNGGIPFSHFQRKSN